MLWVKAFHIIFVVTWFAGLFYLPRLFVYHADAHDQVSVERFIVMERRLFAIMTIGATLATVLGLSLLHFVPGLLQTGWFLVKLVLLAILIGYHIYCWLLLRQFAHGTNSHGARWYRWFNEVPSILLIAIVLLAVLKPALAAAG